MGFIDVILIRSCILAHSDSTRLRRRTLIASLKESKRASKQGSMQASMVWAGESEWGGVVLVVKGIGQGCLIGQGLDGLLLVEIGWGIMS